MPKIWYSPSMQCVMSITYTLRSDETGEHIDTPVYGIVLPGQFLEHDTVVEANFFTQRSYVLYCGTGTRWSEYGKLSHVNTMELPPYSVVVWRKKFRLVGWTKGMVYLYAYLGGICILLYSAPGNGFLAELMIANEFAIVGDFLEEEGFGPEVVTVFKEK